MFTGDNSRRAEEAMKFYVSVFRNSKLGALYRHGGKQEGTVEFGDFMVENGWFAAMDSAHAHGFSFNEAVSFMVNCDGQGEIDYYWGKLSADPKAEQCGWLKDKFGVSWQIVPTRMGEMMMKGTPEQMARVTQAFLPMKKFDLAALEKALEGK
jgi:predicted 3-demethylubiquinone-9 3-methyltransferase (glyoxalase superfamily)